MKKIILKSTAQKQKNNKSGKSGKTFYTVLFLAIVLVGTTGYIMRLQNDAVTKIPEKTISEISASISSASAGDASADSVRSGEKPIYVSSAPEESWQSDDVLPVTDEIIVENPSSDNSGPISDVSEEDPVDTVPEISVLTAPVKGEILKKHSDTELAYSKTMEDWRLHKGEDIKASIGTTVFAAADGTVSECYEDTAYGVTIIIDHGHGLFTKYSNLASYDMVHAGKTVAEGDAIGVVGDTAEFEIADEAHLHFEVIKNGNSVNPADYIRR